MLAILNYSAGTNQPVVARTAVGSFERSFPLPIELSGVTMTINGVACGLKFVSRHQIIFVVPRAISSSVEGTEYEMVVNNNGTVFRGNLTIVPTRPDVFTSTDGPGGRANVRNVTNRVHTTEPFGVYTILLRGGQRVPSRLRILVTGVSNTTSAVIRIRIGSTLVIAPFIFTGGEEVEPGVQAIDFRVPDSLIGSGDHPITVEVDAGGTIFSSRLADTAPGISFY